uniref:anti-CBASS protein Acb1 family protein n=1 Tax=Campylobacter jejuni TaxID=197 RepID=UPI00224276C6
KAINKQKNNNSLILLTKDENYIQSITALSGLDKLIAQLYENVAVSARMPAVKLLGLTPSGFNTTGEFDLNSYYDEIMSLQNATIKPIIEQVLKMLCLELGLDLSPSYEFELLTKISKLDEAQIKNLEADFVGKNITNGVITQEQGFDYLKTNELIDNSLDFEEIDDDLMEGFENGENKEGFETNQANYTSKY